MLTGMTCGRARKLIPLHAAGDLKGRRGRRVAAHVENCDSCRDLAAEFAATREWARAAAEPPEFGAEFYEGLRAGVLDQIKRDRRRPDAPRRAPLFDAFPGRRLAYAASFALALVAFALAFNFYSRRATDATRPPLAATPTNVNEATQPVPQPAPHARGLRPTTPRDDRRRSPRQRMQIAAGGGSIRKGLTLPHRATREPETREVAVAGAALAKSGEVARIEIQTADPNIRIIWLAQQQEQDAPAPRR